jgi:septal ring factor EnvC (AmiA/AmiB activator)
MNDHEWVSQELRRCQDEEKALIERIKIANANVGKAKADLAATQEALAGVRGMIAEFAFQMKYLEKHGELP